MDYSLPRSSIHGIFQARVLQWVAISFPKGFSWPRDWTLVSCFVSRHFIIWATREVHLVTNSPAMQEVREVGLNPRLGRSPGGETGNVLQYSCLENPMDRGAWWATIHSVTSSWTWLKRLYMFALKALIHVCHLPPEKQDRLNSFHGEIFRLCFYSSDPHHDHGLGWIWEISWVNSTAEVTPAWQPGFMNRRECLLSYFIAKLHL